MRCAVTFLHQSLRGPFSDPSGSGVETAATVIQIPETDSTDTVCVETGSLRCLRKSVSDSRRSLYPQRIPVNRD